MALTLRQALARMEQDGVEMLDLPVGNGDRAWQ